MQQQSHEDQGVHEGAEGGEEEVDYLFLCGFLGDSVARQLWAHDEAESSPQLSCSSSEELHTLLYGGSPEGGGEGGRERGRGG